LHVEGLAEQEQLVHARDHADEALHRLVLEDELEDALEAQLHQAVLAEGGLGLDVDAVEVVVDLGRVVAALGLAEVQRRLLAGVQLRDDRALAGARGGEAESRADGALTYAALA